MSKRALQSALVIAAAIACPASTSAQNWTWLRLVWLVSIALAGSSEVARAHGGDDCGNDDESRSAELRALAGQRVVLRAPEFKPGLPRARVQLLAFNDFHGQLSAGAAGGQPAGGQRARARVVPGDGRARVPRSELRGPRQRSRGGLARDLRAAFPYVCANAVSADTQQPILSPNAIRAVASGVAIGFIGAVLRDTPTMVTPSGVAGVRFLDEADAIKAQVRELRRRRVEAIVVLIHQGGPQTTYAGATDPAAPARAERSRASWPGSTARSTSWSPGTRIPSPTRSWPTHAASACS